MLRNYIRYNQISRNEKWFQVTWAGKLLSLISPFRFWARKQQRRPMWLWFLLALSSKRWPWNINHVHMTSSWNSAHHLVNSLSLLPFFTTLSITPHLSGQAFTVTCLCSQLDGENRELSQPQKDVFLSLLLGLFPCKDKGSLDSQLPASTSPILLLLVPTG